MYVCTRGMIHLPTFLSDVNHEMDVAFAWLGCPPPGTAGHCTKVHCQRLSRGLLYFQLHLSIANNILIIFSTLFPSGFDFFLTHKRPAICNRERERERERDPARYTNSLCEPGVPPESVLCIALQPLLEKIVPLLRGASSRWVA